MIPAARLRHFGIVPAADLIGSAFGMRSLFWATGSDMWSSAVTGSGNVTTAGNLTSVNSGGTASSTALLRSQGPGNVSFTHLLASGGSQTVDYTRKLMWRFSIGGFGEQTSTGRAIYSFGKSNADGSGDLPRQGWQIKFENAGGSTTCKIGVHNGTVFGETLVASVGGITGYRARPIVVILEAGLMSFYIEEATLSLATPTATISGAPVSGVGTINGPMFQLEVQNGANAAAHRADLSNLSTFVI